MKLAHGGVQQQLPSSFFFLQNINKTLAEQGTILYKKLF